jgi:hypothetical protein
MKHTIVMKKYFTFCALFLTFSSLALAAPIIIEHTFDWDDTPDEINIEGQLVEAWAFKGGISSDLYPDLYFFTRRFPVDQYGQLGVQIEEVSYEDFPKASSSADDYLSDQLTFETSVSRERNQYYGKITFAPVIRQGNRYKRVNTIRLRIQLRPASTPIATRGPGNTDQSVLRNGTIYKVAVSEKGIHKITYEWLNALEGVDASTIDPRQIKIYGNEGGKLPYYSEATRPDDLAENNIWVSGEGDGSFDPGDYILFYAEGPDKWSYNESLGQFLMEKNIYDDRNYYFIKLDGENGKRVATLPAQGQGSITITSFDDYARLEDENVNLLHEWEKSQGSAKHWFGDHFKVAREYTYNEVFSFPNLLTDNPVKIRASMALRARVRSSFFLDIQGQTLESAEANNVNSINSSQDNTRAYASRATLNDSLFLDDSNISFRLRYPYPQNAGDESEGWLDYVQFNVRRGLVMEGDQLDFRALSSLGQGLVNYQLGNANNNLLIWDVTNPMAAGEVAVDLSGSTLRFSASTGELREFVAFNPTQDLLTPEAVGLIGNQNLHSISQVDMAIIYHADFSDQAERLANHRSEQDDLTIALVDIDQLYNEFSSGRKDPTAIRDFARMLYDRSPNFRYLLLFGDGSFDSRDIYEFGNDYIPVYQKESFNPVEGYPTDDYFGLLFSTDENDPLKGDLTVAVGRIPVKSMEEANEAVDKVIHYDSSEKTLGDWRNRLVFVGDDNDGPGDIDHYKDADNIAEDVNAANPNVNLEKIYLDAFPQESTPGGERIPEATTQLNRSIFKGALAITYLGHGGSKGWAQERVLNISDILSWSNFDQMPIFITATCSFTGYDDPTFTTAGEEVFLNGAGGAVALMTTTRAVYANSNVRMTENALEYLFSRDNGRPLAIGEAFRRGKNDVSGNFNVNNSRKFALIGDPSMPIALPQYEVNTLSVNGAIIDPADSTRTDTLRALQKVTISGEIVNANGSRIQDFNGIIYPTIFDKAQNARTLGQGDNDVYDYRIQKNVIFRGRASVTNGQFEFTFVVPKDINYQIGTGKISYYAADLNTQNDAAGSYEQILIGGTDSNALSDNEGPKVEVFMNTEDFVFGGIVNPTPTLLVKLEDDNGINVVGNSIGHDLEGTLDEDTQNPLLLNDFYESELDDYTKGTVRYPMDELSEGRHQIRVKAWDVANNSAEGYTEFIVASSEEVVLEHVLNYPNPFTDRTCFQFDHNLPGQELDILIQVFTVSGRLVKTIQTTLVTDGALRQDDCVEWDGKDDFGGQLARGVYLYKVKVQAANTGNTTLNGESEFEKLVILK